MIAAKFLVLTAPSIIGLPPFYSNAVHEMSVALRSKNCAVDFLKPGTASEIVDSLVNAVRDKQIYNGILLDSGDYIYISREIQAAVRTIEHGKNPTGVVQVHYGIEAELTRVMDKGIRLFIQEDSFVCERSHTIYLKGMAMLIRKCL